jgi:hypothetical protein
MGHLRVGFRLAQLRPTSTGFGPGGASDGPPLEDGAEPAEVVDDLGGVLTGQRLGRQGLEGRNRRVEQVCVRVMGMLSHDPNFTRLHLAIHGSVS